MQTRRVTSSVTHANLGGGATITLAAPRGVLVRIAASEAEHLALLSTLAGRPPADAFPAVHGIDTAAAALAPVLPRGGPPCPVPTAWSRPSSPGSR